MKHRRKHHMENRKQMLRCLGRVLRIRIEHQAHDIHASSQDEQSYEWQRSFHMLVNQCSLSPVWTSYNTSAKIFGIFSLFITLTGSTYIYSKCKIYINVWLIRKYNSKYNSHTKMQPECSLRWQIILLHSHKTNSIKVHQFNFLTKVHKTALLW